MLSPDNGGWQWRATLAWALLGPSVVLLIQMETLFVIADAFDAIPLRAGVSRWTVGAAVAVFFLVGAAQLAVYLWRRNRQRRDRQLNSQMEFEAKLASKLHPSSASSADASDLEMSRPDQSLIRGIIARFGLEPTWAYQVLSELGLPDAVRITRQARLADARTAGMTTVAPLGGLLVVAFVLLLFLPQAQGALAAKVLFAVVAAILPLSVLAWSVPTVTRGEEQFYPLVERLLELRRFDLYRALSLQVPVDTSDEQRLSVIAWRRQQGNVRYVNPVEPAEEGEARVGAQELADLLRGPQLIGYEGFVSWEVVGGRAGDDGQVLLTFAGTPTTGAVQSSPLHVEGTSTETDAPFHITANSQDVVLSLVRTTVQAPVDGRPATVGFAFTRPQDAETKTGEAVVVAGDPATRPVHPVAARRRRRPYRSRCLTGLPSGSWWREKRVSGRSAPSMATPKCRAGDLTLTLPR